MSGKNKEWKETVTYKTTQPQWNKANRITF